MPVVTVKNVYRQTGVSQKTGKPWLRFDVVDDHEVRYSTFKQEIGEMAEGHLGRPVEVDFHTDHNGQYSNNVLDGLVPFEGASAKPHPEEFGGPPQITHQHVDKQTQITRHGALARAIETAAAGITTDVTVKDLFRLADEYVKYIEQGSEAFGQF